MVNRFHSTKGFSLMEAMIVVAIIGIVSAVAPRLVTQVAKFFILSQTRLELQQEARASMAIITQFVRQAQTSTIRIDQVNGQPYYSRISFTTIQGTAMTFYQSGTNLIRTQGTRTNTMSKNLRYLAFTLPRSDDMTIVSLAMTLEKSIYQAQTKALHMASEKVEIMNDL